MERDNAVDSVAGLMIIYMVFTHVCQHFHIQDTSFYMSLEHILYFFMPWFFYKAGLFFKVSDNKIMFLKSTRRLIIPFIKYSFIGHVCYCLVSFFNGNLHLSTIIPYRILLMHGSIPGNLPLWFLLSLFLCRVILNILLNKAIPISLVAILSLSIAFLLHEIGFVHPFYAANIWTGLFFMSIGYMTNKMILTPPHVILCLIIYSISIIYPSFVGMRSNHLYYGFYLLWIVYSLCGIITINLFGDYIRRIKIFSIIGKYSMQIYCIHWIPLMFI